jgi:hypothetical protein
VADRAKSYARAVHNYGSSQAMSIFVRALQGGIWPSNQNPLARLVTTQTGRDDARSCGQTPRARLLHITPCETDRLSFIYTEPVPCRDTLQNSGFTLSCPSVRMAATESLQPDDHWEILRRRSSSPPESRVQDVSTRRGKYNYLKCTQCRKDKKKVFFFRITMQLPRPLTGQSVNRQIVDGLTNVIGASTSECCVRLQIPPAEKLRGQEKARLRSPKFRYQRGPENSETMSPMLKGDQEYAQRYSELLKSREDRRCIALPPRSYRGSDPSEMKTPLPPSIELRHHCLLCVKHAAH